MQLRFKTKRMNFIIKPLVSHHWDGPAASGLVLAARRKTAHVHTDVTTTHEKQQTYLPIPGAMVARTKAPFTTAKLQYTDFIWRRKTRFSGIYTSLELVRS